MEENVKTIKLTDSMNYKEELNRNPKAPQLIDEDMQKIFELAEEIKKNHPEYDCLDKDTPVETGESRLINVSIDPVTGKETILNAEEVNQDNTTGINDIFGDDIDLNIDFDENAPITLEELKSFFENTKDNPVINGNLSLDDLTSEDLSELLELGIKKQKDQEFEVSFKSLPENCKKFINKTIGPGCENAFNPKLNELRNTLSNALIDELISSITVSRAGSSINSSIEKIFDKMNAEIGDTIVGFTEDRNAQYKKYIEENITDPEKKEKALSLLTKIDTAYELTDFKEFCKKCKIRKIDVENPKEPKNYDIDALLAKYDNNADYNIYNIYNAQAVLARNINNDENMMFNDKQIRAFMIAFARYCMNFSPSNTDQHIFMFYTIYNIVLTDVNKGEKSSVSIEFLNNVKECINNLTNRNLFLLW